MLCGTALTNRKRFPKKLIKKKMKSGTSEVVYNGKVCAAVWCGKKPIYFVSSKYRRLSSVVFYLQFWAF